MDLNLLDDDDLFLHDMVRWFGCTIGRIVHLVEPNLEENRVRTVRNKNYFEMTIPRYSDIQFREHFRMSRQTFQLLLDIIGVEYQVVSRTISLEKKLLFTIWMLSKPESFLAAGDRFNISKSFSHTIFYEIVFLINNLVNEYIRWPNNHNQTINAFRARSRGIPGIVGAIDGCYIPIKQPEGNPHDYFNRKQFHSIILQGICDENAQFIDVNIGQPGRMHDARVFRLSPIYERLIDVENPLLSANKHIIGDSAYPLMQNLMKPYQDNGHLTRSQQIFNIKICSVRSTIERAFGLLKVKFRRLQYLDVRNAENAVKIVDATCVLHNFILKQNNAADNYNIEDINVNVEDIDDGNLVREQERGPAEQKRQHFANICTRHVD